MNLVEEDTAVVGEPATRKQRRRSTRRLRIVPAVAVCAALVVAAILIGRPDRGITTSVVAPTSGDSVPATTAPLDTPGTATPVPQAVPEQLNTSRLRLDGIGPVVVGMSLDEASGATGQAIRIDPRTDLGRGCAHATADAGQQGLRFMVVNDRIVRVEAGPGPVRTLSGVGVGSTEAEVMATYPGRIRVEPNPYSGHLGGKDLIYVPDESSRHLSLLFYVFGGQVQTFRAGFFAAVMAPEGCS